MRSRADIPSTLSTPVAIAGLKSKIGLLLLEIYGPRFCLKWLREFEVAADVVYFGLTTLSGGQTLGEEYVNIVLTVAGLPITPSIVSRIMMVLMQCMLPYAIDKIASRIEKSVDNQTFGLTRTGKEHIKKLIVTIRHVLILTHRCNLALFYINGIYYHLSKRFTSIQYVLTRKSSVGEHSGSSYRLLGWLCVIQPIDSLGRKTVPLVVFRAIILGHFCQNWVFFVLLSWLPTYFTETYPSEKVNLPVFLP